MTTAARRIGLLPSAIALTVFAGAAVADGSTRSAAATNPSNPTDRILPTHLPPAQIAVMAFEDLTTTIALDPAFAGLDVLTPPRNGTLVSEVDRLRYVPRPDFHGDDVVVLGKGSPVAALHIKVLSVNDAPRFLGGGGRAHEAGEIGFQAVRGWVSGIAAGPADEAAQQVQFRAEVVDDPNGVVKSLGVSPEGTLHYDLSGRPGVATWSVQAVDDGGDVDGGVPVSTAQTVRIGSGTSIDLSIEMISAALAAETGAPRPYQLVVRNLSSATATDARVVDVLGKDEGMPTWRCEGFGGASCPKAGFVDGRLDTSVDLPGGSVAVFTIEGVTIPYGQRKHVAFVVPPDYVKDPNLDNNEAYEN
jgi:hypothetical protein